MKVSYNWLKDYLDFKSSPEEISNILTNSGLEVEKMSPRFHDFESFNKLVIGKVLDYKKHPNADKLKITKVDLGNSTKNIICGATNIKKDMFVVVAMVGTTITNLNNESLTIKKVKIRGEYSEGMICSEFEIGFGDSNKGIMELDKKLNFKVGQSFQDYFKLKQDYIFEIGLTPNRTDAFGHIGVCRDIKSVINLNGANLDLKKPILDFKIDNKNLPFSIEIEDESFILYYSGLTIQNVTIKDSPIWLKQKLNSIGINPINNVVDVTNFVLFETGNPLHAFDYDLVTNHKLIVKKSQSFKNFTKIDGKDIKLNDDLIISDSDKPICLAGIIGGKESSVSSNTKNIFLESASFNPSLIRSSSKKHSIQTDASYRFERGVDYNNCVYALQRAALMIKQLLPESKISSEIISFSNKNYTSKKTIDWSFKKFNKITGQIIPKEIVEKILFDLDFEILNNGDLVEGCTISVPSFRFDVTRDVDLFEEILRIYGYEKIENAKNISFPVLRNKNSYFENNVKKITSTFLSNNGFFEIKTNSLISLKMLEKYNLGNLGINIINASSSEMNVLRPTLLFGGLEAISYNVNRKNNNILFYEFGNVYINDEQFYDKPELNIFLSGNFLNENWNKEAEKLDIFHAKGLVEKLFDLFGINFILEVEKNNIKSNDINNDFFDSILLYKVGNNITAKLGLLSKKIVSDFNIKQNVYYCSIDWSYLTSLISTENIKFNNITKFPKVRRDLALVVDETISFLQLKNLAFKTSIDVLREVLIFDVYRGDKIEKGKKSYAMGFIFQNDNATLTDQFIDNEMRNIYDSFNKNLSAVLRDGEL